MLLAVAVIAAHSACAGDAPVVRSRRPVGAEAEVVRASLVTLFSRRERAQSIAIWTDSRERSPTLSAFGGRFDAHDTLQLVDLPSGGGAWPFALEATSLRDMQAFFKRAPAGWDSWFSSRQGSGGVVEIVRPRIAGDSASIIIGRACGEICRGAWRVSLVREGGVWRTHNVVVLTVPR